jgi:ketosteroid isomerase-like protein
VSGKDTIETIKSVYAAFGRGDVGAIVDAVTDDVDWASDTSSDGAPWLMAVWINRLASSPSPCSNAATPR